MYYVQAAPVLAFPCRPVDITCWSSYRALGGPPTFLDRLEACELARLGTDRGGVRSEESSGGGERRGRGRGKRKAVPSTTTPPRSLIEGGLFLFLALPPPISGPAIIIIIHEHLPLRFVLDGHFYFLFPIPDFPRRAFALSHCEEPQEEERKIERERR